MTVPTTIVLIVMSFLAADIAADDFVLSIIPRDCCGRVALADRRENRSEAAVDKDSGSILQISPDSRPHDWMYVVLHHSGTGVGSVESIHNDHSQRKDRYGNSWLGIGYHFVIGNGSGMPDGQIEATFRWKKQIHGAHSGSTVHNSNGIGICLIGNFQEHAPTDKQLEAVKLLVGQLSTRYRIPSRLVIGHKSVTPTACPGLHFPLQDVVRDSFSETAVSD